MKFWERLKSPVVLIQLISLIAATIVALHPDVSATVKIIAGCLTEGICIFAGLNNPTDPHNF